MGRYWLVVCLLCVLTAGCVSPTGGPPPFPQPSFEYEYSRDDGATVLTVTVVDDGGLADQPIRILVGQRVAYANGSFRRPYTASTAYPNEWADGVDTGDSIGLTNGSSFAPGVEIAVQIRRSDTGEFVTVGETEPGGRSPSTTPASRERPPFAQRTLSSTDSGTSSASASGVRLTATPCSCLGR